VSCHGFFLGGHKEFGSLLITDYHAANTFSSMNHSGERPYISVGKPSLLPVLLENIKKLTLKRIPNSRI
jgi:hypothetical protein